MVSSIDQLGRLVKVIKKPVKIISLVPSLTELLFDLGLDNEVAAITKFCIHPESWLYSKVKIGGTKNLDLDKIVSIQPDFIIANKEENEESQVRKLMENFPVWVSDIHKLHDAVEMIREISMIVGKETVGTEMVNNIKIKFSKKGKKGKKITCAYLIWNKPMMTVGGDTFISNMLEYADFINVFNEKSRYPEITAEELKKKSPDVLFLSSEPFPYFNKLIDQYKTDFPKINIQLVDGELFSWYGSRLLKSPSYFQTLREKIESV
jgi:ABC-type Fe3+-hydroxamate transport system substrate-binding protein